MSEPSRQLWNSGLWFSTCLKIFVKLDSKCVGHRIVLLDITSHYSKPANSVFPVLEECPHMLYIPAQKASGSTESKPLFQFKMNVQFMFVIFVSLFIKASLSLYLDNDILQGSRHCEVRGR